MSEPDHDDTPAEPSATPEPTTPPDPSRHIPWDSLTRLAGVRAGLPEDQHAAFDELITDLGPSRCADLLGMLPAPSSSAPAAPKPQPTRDLPAAAPRSPGPSYPRSREEWIESVRRARQGDATSRRLVDQLKADPDFRGDRLPSNREHANRLARQRVNASRPAAKKERK